MKIVKEGLWIILPSTILPILLMILTGWRSWALIFIFDAIMIFFFRDPRRCPPVETQGILSPADGKIIMVKHSQNGFIIFIELSFLNCHLQRSPISGEVTNIIRVSGHKRAFHWFLPKIGYIQKKIRATVENKQNKIEIQMDNSIKIWITQIVGMFARRLKSFVKIGQKITKGDKIGLIYFGSMVKLEIQGAYKLQVQNGDKVKAGLTIIAVPKNA